MKNVDFKVSKDNILTITVDLKQDFGESSSGKNIIIASTGGNQALPAPNTEIKVGLNVYKSK